MYKLSFSLLALLSLTACATRTLESNENAARKVQIKELCFQDVVVTNNISIGLAEPNYGSSRDTYGNVSDKTRVDGTNAARKTIALYQSEILKSLGTGLRPYDIKFYSCTQAQNPNALTIQFVIHRAFAERAPVGLYKTGVGVNVKIFDKDKTQAIWESEYVAGTEGAIGDADLSNVEAFTRKIVWQLYQNDWIEKK